MHTIFYFLFVVLMMKMSVFFHAFSCHLPKYFFTVSRQVAAKPPVSPSLKQVGDGFSVAVFVLMLIMIKRKYER